MAISAKQYEQMVGRMTGRGKKEADKLSAELCSQHKIIIGIDPSLRGTGFGVIRFDEGLSDVLEHGTIVCKKDWKNSRCLARIHDVLREAILKYQPTACAIEGLFLRSKLSYSFGDGRGSGRGLGGCRESGIGYF